MSKADCHILVDEVDDKRVALVLYQNMPHALYFDDLNEDQYVGAVFKAKLIQKLSHGQGCFFESLKDKKKFYTKKIPKELVSNDPVKIQIKKLYEKTHDKDSVVTTALEYRGKYLVYMPTEKGIHISKKQAGRLNVEDLKNNIPLLNQGGWILRSLYSPDHTDYNELQDEAETLISQSESESFKGYDALERAYLDHAAYDCSITLNETYQASPYLLKNDQISYSTTKSPIESNGYDSFLNDLLTLSTVDIDGGALHFHEIPHGPVFIDIDCDFIEHHRVKQLSLITKEIMRYIRLKNYAGVLLIDYPYLKDKPAKLAIQQELERQKKHDKAPIHLLGFSKAGHFELIREKIGPVFKERNH